MSSLDRAGEKDRFSRRQITIIFKIAFLEAMALTIIIPSVTSTGEISLHLGIWSNFASDPSCSAVASPNPSGFTPCELFGSKSYRQPYIYNQPSSSAISQLNVGLTAVCVTPSISPSRGSNAYIQLQYANYSFLTGTNLTGFTNIGGVLNVDNQQSSNPCPGSIDNQFDGPLPTINPQSPQGYIFRVLGFGSGSPGDSIRIQSLNIVVSQVVQRIVEVIVNTASTSTFTWIAITNYANVGIFNLGIKYIATNQTSACGTSNHCLKSGTSSCSFPSGSTRCPASGTVSVTFPTPAFTGTVQVTAVPVSVSATLFILLGTITIFNTEVN